MIDNNNLKKYNINNNLHDKQELYSFNNNNKELSTSPKQINNNHFNEPNQLLSENFIINISRDDTHS